MCGLTGYIGSEPIPSELLIILMVTNLKRGRDSAGYYTYTNKGDSLQKALNDVDENLLIDHPVTSSSLFIGHCRASTSHHTTKEVNNAHPFAFKGVVLAHNGVIDNIHALKQKVPYIPVDSDKWCDVDSKYIAWRISHDKGYSKILQEYAGKAALIWCSLIKDPSKMRMFFYRDNERPLFMGRLPRTGGLVLHSLKTSLQLIGCENIEEVPIHKVHVVNRKGEIVDIIDVDRSSPVNSNYYTTTHSTTTHTTTTKTSRVGDDKTLEKYVDIADKFIDKINGTATYTSSSNAHTYKEVQNKYNLMLAQPEEEKNKLFNILSRLAAAGVDFIANIPCPKDVKRDYSYLSINDEFRAGSHKTPVTDKLLCISPLNADDWAPKTHRDLYTSIDGTLLKVVNDLTSEKGIERGLAEFLTQLMYRVSYPPNVPHYIPLSQRIMYKAIGPVYQSAGDTTRRIDIEEYNTRKRINGIPVKLLCHVEYAEHNARGYEIFNTFLDSIKLTNDVSTAVTIINKNNIDYHVDAVKYVLKDGDSVFVSVIKVLQDIFTSVVFTQDLWVKYIKNQNLTSLDLNKQLAIVYYGLFDDVFSYISMYNKQIKASSGVIPVPDVGYRYLKYDPDSLHYLNKGIKSFDRDVALIYKFGNQNLLINPKLLYISAYKSTLEKFTEYEAEELYNTFGLIGELKSMPLIRGLAAVVALFNKFTKDCITTDKESAEERNKRILFELNDFICSIELMLGDEDIHSLIKKECKDVWGVDYEGIYGARIQDSTKTSETFFNYEEADKFLGFLNDAESAIIDACSCKFIEEHPDDSVKQKLLEIKMEISTIAEDINEKQPTGI